VNNTTHNTEKPRKLKEERMKRTTISINEKETITQKKYVNML